MISWQPKPDFLKFFSNSTDSDKTPLSSSVIENGVLSPQELDPSSPPVSSPLPSDSSEPNNPSPQLPLNVPPPQAASPPPSNSNSLPPSLPSNVSPLPVSPPSPPLSNSPPTGIAQPSFPPAKPSPSSGNSLPLSPPVISMPAPAAVETPPSSPVDGSSRQTVTPPLQNAPSGATPSPLPLSGSPPNVVPPSNDPNPIPPTAMTTPSTPSQSTTPSSQQSNSFPSLTSPSTQSGASPSSQQVLPRSSWNSSKAIPEILIGISLATVVLIIGLVAFVFFRLGKDTKKRRTNDLPGKPVSSGVGNGYGSNRGNVSDHSDAIGNSKQWFTYKELLEITDGFSWQNLLGEGGFGCVYKGLLPDGREVAVKQLKAGNGQGEREFRAEAEIISRVHHRHLVSVVGYCIDENQRLLVYEYVPNKTLEHHLHGKGVPVMDWAKRVKIAIGAAKGLAYLHEDCHPRIIHRDIKSANILLDNSFEAKVADFGLAKPSNDSKSHVSTRVMGTFGYMAPEYASSGKLTDRSDVFSFGVVLLELVTGLRPVDTSRPLGEESLVEWARPLLVRALDGGDLGELVDSRVENSNDSSEMLNMIEVAAACVRHSAWRRPRMVQVVRALGYERDMPDITNGVKVGQSIEYDSSQYSADIREFRKRSFSSGDYSPDHGYSGDTDQKNSTYSEEYQSREAQSWQGSALNSNGVCEQLRV